MRLLPAIVFSIAMCSPYVASAQGYPGCSDYGERCANETLGDYYQRQHDNTMREFRNDERRSWPTDRDDWDHRHHHH